jgi:hypothetical protein
VHAKRSGGVGVAEPGHIASLPTQLWLSKSRSAPDFVRVEVNCFGAPHSGFAVNSSRINARTSGERPAGCRLFQVQNRRKPRRCHAITVLRLDDVNGRAPARHARASRAQRIRSADVKSTRGRRDRWTTASWWRSVDDLGVQRGARLDDKSERVEQRVTTDATVGAIGEKPITSMEATCGIAGSHNEYVDLISRAPEQAKQISFRRMSVAGRTDRQELAPSTNRDWRTSATRRIVSP